MHTSEKSVIYSPTKNTGQSMGSILDFFAQNSKAIGILLLTLGGIALLVQWFSWIFRLGRYASPPGEDPTTRQSIRFLLAEILAKIINDFRHLLALIIVTIFAFVLIYVMLKAGSDFDNLKEGVQVVVAALGGLIGSIIGYYFGESAARGTSDTITVDTSPGELEQGNVPPIEPVPPPPGLNNGDEAGDRT